MSISNFKELINLNNSSITEEIVAMKKQLFDLRLKKATRQAFKPHLFKTSKRKIAQLLTLESQKKQTTN
jgi:large subunit ribosomal protein L29